MLCHSSNTRVLVAMQKAHRILCLVQIGKVTIEESQLRQCARISVYKGEQQHFEWNLENYVILLHTAAFVTSIKISYV